MTVNNNNAVNGNTIGVYNGPGIDQTSAVGMQALLQKLTGKKIVYFKPNCFKNPDWRKELSTFVVPGAESTTAVLHGFGDSNLEKLSQAIATNNLGYIGVCAGAYAVSRRLLFQFQGQQPLELDISKVAKAAPQLYQGTAAGPVAPNTSTPDMRAVTVGSATVKIPYKNGPHFVTDEGHEHRVRVLAHYTGTNRAAAVHIGKAVLSGVHPELELTAAGKVLARPTAAGEVLMHTMLKAAKLAVTVLKK